MQRHFHSIEMNTLNIHVQEAQFKCSFSFYFHSNYSISFIGFFYETFRAKLRPDQNFYKLEFFYRKYDEPRKIRSGFTHLRNDCISKNRIFHRSKSFQRVIIQLKNKITKNPINLIVCPKVPPLLVGHTQRTSRSQQRPASYEIMLICMVMIVCETKWEIIVSRCILHLDETEHLFFCHSSCLLFLPFYYISCYDLDNILLFC